jgi:hypothetical protein
MLIQYCYKITLETVVECSIIESMTEPKQVKFQATKPSELPLNGKQLDLLALVGDAGPDGAIVYCKGPDATIHALANRGLVEHAGKVTVVVMGQLEDRFLWKLSAKGKTILGGGA